MSARKAPPPPREQPTLPQRIAADPGGSAFVSANAGSGKTRVLTHRVARLLLAGAEPERILCLTYTKAAAAEMQIRLFDMLGRWAMEDDRVLATDLAALEGRTVPERDPERLAQARRLFARALETPGGLKIQTIHAFCDAVLRRFPLEAGVAPGFEVLDDRQSADILATIRERLAEREPSFADMAQRLTDQVFAQIVEAIRTERQGFAAPSPTDLETRLAAHFGTAGDRSAAAREALDRIDWPAFTRHANLLLEAGGVQDQKAAEAIGSAIAFSAAAASDEPEFAVQALIEAFLTEGRARSERGFPVKAVLDIDPAARDRTDRLIDWALEAREALNAAEIAARTRDLNRFAAALLGAYEATKARRGLLDFDDLVERVRRLLAESDMAAWVLYRLDRGIDHVLVDEAQDTAPAQWEVIDAIVAEFQAGDGARDGRTLFVVGDEKQSIYSFQGAEPAQFARMRATNAARLAALGETLAEPALETSFRSAPAILRFVDRLFAADPSGLSAKGEAPSHIAHRSDAIGRVDLWPLAVSEPQDGGLPWDVPVDTPPPSDAKARLARIVAEEIRRLLAHGTMPSGRAVQPRDILILVRRRDALARGILRNLTALGVPVAGADRIRLSASLAVQDLLALMQVAVTPDDDLALAALLRSPLCGLSEEALYDLAYGREGPLWAEATGHKAPQAVAGFLRDMAANADYLRPYDFLERALILHDGRRKLLARLGAEAEDPIDELLTEALAYEGRSVPSLTGFIDWIETGETDIRREMDRGRDLVRLMTVHGAKGLEAPLVILPDTMSPPESRPQGPLLLRVGEDTNAGPITAWAGPKDLDDRLCRDARERETALQEAERRRLLYVAATRAEDWLIVCGAGDPAKTEGTWYGLARAAMAGAAEIAAPEGLGDAALRMQDPGGGLDLTAPPAAAPALAGARPPKPGWLAPAPAERARRIAAPSEHDEEVGQEAGGRGRGIGREAAMLRGSAVHLLLERFGDGTQFDPSAASKLVAAAFPALPARLATEALVEAEAVLNAPFAPQIFGPDGLPEVAIALADGSIGRIDRLVLRASDCLILDYKTDAEPPADPAGTPRAYLKQLSAYRRALGAIHPGRRISAAIVWTATPRLSFLPENLLEP